MVMTILEGEVTEDKAVVLLDNYNEAVQELEPGMVETFLTQDTKNPTMWKIITVWESKEALMKMREQGTPKGVLLFQSVGTEPTLSIHQITASSQ